jgi:suppressor for copper-sensitivity B
MARSFVMARLGWLTALGLAAALAAVPAAAAVGDWAAGSKARARLLAAGVGADGHLSAAVEILLPPGWKTYWRYPGDAGIAPTFDFSASRNIGPVEIGFPPPHRLDDGYTITNVYTDRVVLPVSAAVTDPGRAVDLVMSLDLGVCEQVCVPDHVAARLLVPAGMSDAVAARTIAEARDALPSAAVPGELAVDRVVRDGGTDKRPVFRVELTAPDAANATVFVEGPSDWFPDAARLVEAKGDKATFTVKVDRLVAKTAIAGASLRFTVLAGGRAVEQAVTLE